MYTLNPDELFSLTSPGYPQPYPVNTDCSWVIHSEGAGYPTLIVIDFNLYHGFDFVYIKNAETNILSLTGSNAPSSVTTNSTSLTVHFYSYLWDLGSKGFLFDIIWSPKNSKVSICTPLGISQNIRNS